MRGIAISRPALHRLWANPVPPPFEGQLVFAYNAFRFNMWCKRLGRLVRLESSSGLAPASTKTVIIRVREVSREAEAIRVFGCVVWRTGLHDKHAEGVLDYLDGHVLNLGRRIGILEAACEDLQLKVVELMGRLNRQAASPPPSYQSIPAGAAYLELTPRRHARAPTTIPPPPQREPGSSRIGRERRARNATINV
jgi:hypothetical protein